MLTPEKRKVALTIARSSLEAAFGLPLRVEPPEDDDQLGLAGVFVTLEEGGDLRGCIGSLDFSKPLAHAIWIMARAAAFNDPRFEPLGEEELDEVRIELSVLSPPVPIKNPEDINVGRHGLIISKGLRRGLLLPQVATRHNLTPERFLELTCQKAGLPQDSWKDSGTTVEIFEAEVFGEGE